MHYEALFPLQIVVIIFEKYGSAKLRGKSIYGNNIAQKLEKS